MMKSLVLSTAFATAALSLSVPAVAADAKVASSDAQGQVNESLTVLEHMKKDPDVVGLLRRAKGVVILPRYAQGGVIVGGRGGEGVLLVHMANGAWSDPVFYNIGGVSIGAQAGAAGGSMALLLMSRQAVKDVTGNNNFSLNAKAGLSVVNYSAKAQAGWGRADVVVWSDVKGAYAGATIGVSDIARDVQQTRHYYPGATDGDRVLSGRLRNKGAHMLVASLP